MDIKTQKNIISTLALSFLIGGGLWFGTATGSGHAADRSSWGNADRAAVIQDKAAMTNRAGNRAHRESLPLLAETAALLGIGVAELLRRLRTRRVADLAAEAGYSSSDFVAKLLEPRRSKLETAVAEGRFPAERAEAVRDRWDQLAQAFVNRRPDSPHPMRPDWTQVAQSLGLEKATLVERLRRGESVADTAAAHGVDEASLQAGLRSRLESVIGGWLEQRKLTDRS